MVQYCFPFGLSEFPTVSIVNLYTDVNAYTNIYVTIVYVILEKKIQKKILTIGELK